MASTSPWIEGTHLTARGIYFLLIYLALSLNKVHRRFSTHNTYRVGLSLQIG